MIKIFIMNHSKLAIKNKILNKIIIIKLHSLPNYVYKDFEIRKTSSLRFLRLLVIKIIIVL